MLSFFRRLFGISKYSQPPGPSEEEKKQARTEFELRDKILPLSREQNDQTGFALTGAALRKYDHAKATYYQELGLPDKSPDGVQTTLIKKTLDGLMDAHEKAVAMLKKANDAAPENRTLAASLKPRTMKLNISTKLFDELKLSEGVQTLKFAQVRNSLRVDSKRTGALDPFKDACDRYHGHRSDRRSAIESTVKKIDPPSSLEIFEEAVNQEAVNDFLKARIAAKYDCKDFGLCKDDQYEHLTDLYGSLGPDNKNPLRKASPTDAISFRDFPSLQIAWESVWTDALSQGRHEGHIPKRPKIVKRADPSINEQAWLNYVLMMEDRGEDWRVIREYASEVVLFRDIASIADSGHSSMSDVELERLGELASFVDVLGKVRWAEHQFESSSSYVESSRSHYHNLEIEGLGKIRALIDEGNKAGLSVPTTFTDETEYDHPVFTHGVLNYGVITTYRQTWKPIKWQVGDLVESIPLTPGETRKYTKKVSQIKKRSRKEIENNSSFISRTDASERKAEQEIMDRSLDKTSFEANAQGGGRSGGGGAAFQISSEKESKDTKGNVRGATVKAAEEVRQEHKIEINQEDSYQSELTTTNEIRNPNDEITVTYLFYELQRVFQISEHLRELESVVLVPNKVDAKNEIDWDWIGRYHWILKRVSLDVGFLPAIDIALIGSAAIDAKVATELDKVSKVLALVETVNTELGKLGEGATGAQTAADAVSRTIKSIMEAESQEGMGDKISEWFGGSDDQDIEAAKYDREIALEKLDVIENKMAAASGRLSQAQNALDRAVDKYNAVLVECNTQIRKVDSLVEHIQDNMIYYMQAIWSYENPDQRYLRLFSIDVPRFIEYPDDDQDVYVHEITPISTFDMVTPGVTVEVILPPPSAAKVSRRKLHEIADLDNLLGFKGNYMIFPAKEQSYISAYMAQSYLGGYIDSFQGGPNRAVGFDADTVNSSLHLLDPDKFGVSTESVRQAIDAMPEDNEARQRLNDYLREVENVADSDSDNIIVPTDSLYIEALPGYHSVLERFKEQHRQIDVLKAREEWRQEQLETLRKEGLVFSGQLHDPDVDKNIRISSNTDVDTSVDPTNVGE